MSETRDLLEKMDERQLEATMGVYRFRLSNQLKSKSDSQPRRRETKPRHVPRSGVTPFTSRITVLDSIHSFVRSIVGPCIESGKRDVWAMKHTTDLLKKIHKGISHDGKDD